VIAKTFVAIANWVNIRTDPLFLRLSGYPDTLPSYQPAPGFSYSFLQFPPPSRSEPNTPHTITADVVIVGSGCGGAVCAKILAEAGHSVVVVDKAYSFSPSHFPMSQEQGTHHLFENHGFVGSDDLSINLAAGSSWGGGGTVNWGVSLPTQDFVRREWADKDELPLFTSAEYQDCLDRVCEFMGVSDQGVRHNHRNQTLLDGCRKLGWEAKTTPVNSAGRDHYCGQCHFGCATAGKKGPAVSWLPAAAESGAQFIEGFDVEKVLFQGEDGDNGDKVARGVVGTWTSRDASGGVHGSMEERVRRKVEIRAKKVILSTGALWSPVLLLNSGIKVS
jgi:choline dehydrogenase-like flavoprotein